MSNPTSESSFTTAATLLVGLPFFAIIPFPIPEFSPFSMTTVLPVVLIANWKQPLALILGVVLVILVLLAPRFLFLRVVQQIQRTGNLVPRWTLPTLIVIFLLSATWAAFGWKDTISYVSLGRANALAIQSLVPPIIIVGWFVVFRSKLTERRSILLHWLAIAWLLWSAFPWYGELL